MIKLKNLDNIYFFIIFIFFAYFGFYSKTQAANEDKVCTAATNLLSELFAGNNCYITPPEIVMNVKGIWYCYAEPAAPTATLSNPAQGLGTSAALSNPGDVLKQANGTGCSRRIFKGSNDLTLNEGVASGLVGAGGAGQTQSFQWVVLQIEPTIGMRGSFTFNDVIKTSETKYPTSTAGSASVLTGGTICNTKGGTILVENGGVNTIECTSDASVTPGLNNYVYNRIGTQNYGTWILSNGKTAKAWITNSQNKLADGLTASEVTTLQGQVAGNATDPFTTAYNALASPPTSILVAFENPFTWYKCANKQKGTKSIDLSWYVSNALRVEFSADNIINLVAPASFDMFLEAPLKSGGSC